MDFGFGVWGLGLGFGFRVWGWGLGLGFGVWGWGLGLFLGLSQILTCISGETDITNRDKKNKNFLSDQLFFGLDLTDKCL